jgi:hypothetical protein
MRCAVRSIETVLLSRRRRVVDMYNEEQMWREGDWTGYFSWKTERDWCIVALRIERLE